MGARWSSTTKRVVVALFAVASLYIVYRAGDIVRPFVWAGVLAFVLLPVVGLLERRLSLPRTAAAAIVFLGLLAAIIGGGRILVPLAIDQVRDLQRTLPTLVANAQNTLAETADQVGLGDLNALIVGFTGVTDLSPLVARGAVPFLVRRDRRRHVHGPAACRGLFRDPTRHRPDREVASRDRDLLASHGRRVVRPAGCPRGRAGGGDPSAGAHLPGRKTSRRGPVPAARAGARGPASDGYAGDPRRRSARALLSGRAERSDVHRRLVPRRGDDASPVRHPGPVGRGSPSGHRRAADRRRRRASVITNIGSSLLVRGRWGARRSLVGLPWWARLGPDFGGAAWRVRARVIAAGCGGGSPRSGAQPSDAGGRRSGSGWARGPGGRIHLHRHPRGHRRGRLIRTPGRGDDRGERRLHRTTGARDLSRCATSAPRH